MIEEINLRVTPEIAGTTSMLEKELRGKLAGRKLNDWRVIRRSVDARGKTPIMNLTLKVAIDDSQAVGETIVSPSFPALPSDAPQVVIVGAGPAGLFAALRSIQRGVRPIVIERGRDVDSRRLDLARLSRERKVDCDSNYCFGEGGAGAYSDGKLYTRSKKRGNNKEVLEILVAHGASEEILIDAHPHIGSDKLPLVIKRIRETIIKSGGEVHFSTRMTKILLDGNKAIGVETSKGESIYGPVILATGHSARDVYRSLNESGIRLEAKGFAMGVRLEHPQKLIDRIQYNSVEGRGEWLPAAEYNMVTQAAGRGVYSFCMCPGGVIVPAASGPEELVVNGMSASARAGRWANSGMVVEIRPGDFPEYAHFDNDPFELMRLQEDVEKRFYLAAGESLTAPAQRMTDYVAGKLSESLPASSYIPGLLSSRVDKLLPPFVAERLKEGFKAFGRKAKGFLTDEAVVIGVESRTSSPVRLPRDKDTLCHTEIENLYPAGEGAGYAGGIVSAALDGIRCADSIADCFHR